jgi:hypothetical protein
MLRLAIAMLGLAGCSGGGTFIPLRDGGGVDLAGIDLAGIDLSGADFAGGGGGDAAGGADLTMPAAKCPTIMILADATGSMGDFAFGGVGASKWTILQNGVQHLLDTYGSQARFGVEVFSSAGLDDQACLMDAQVGISPAAGTAQAIEAMVMQAAPNNGSNVGEAVERAAADPAMRDLQHPPYELLITDGAPNCNTGDQNGSGAFTLGQITSAAGQIPPVHTVVYGFDQGTLDPVMGTMAQDGQEPQAGCGGVIPCYYRATTQMDLSAAIDTVMARIGVPGCDPN